jgi:tetratricopeptide (TPR) repeat protein
MRNSSAQLEQVLQSVMSCIQTNNFAGADFFLAAIRQQPDSRVAYFSALIAQQRGRQDAAISAFAEAAELDNFNSELTADCIFKLIGYNVHETAFILNQKAMAKKPGYFGYHFCAGLIYLHDNELELAVSEFRLTTKLKPELLESYAMAGQTLHLIGRLNEAEEEFLKALQLSPNDARSHQNLAALLIDCEVFQGAYEHAKKAVSLSAQSADAWALLSSAARQLELLDEALSAAENACQLAPENVECRRSRGKILKELGYLRKASLDFNFAAGKRFAANTSGNSNLKEHRFLSRAKIEHDIEQFDYLASIYENRNFSLLASQYREILNMLPQCARTDILPIPQSIFIGMQQHYNRYLHLESTDFSGTALSASLDTDTVEEDYFARSPGITWIDNLLSPEALAALRRYCLESTIWFDFNHTNGYLGAEFENGFTDPLLLQICDELKIKFPKIFGAYPLMQMWAFKYDSRLHGIQLHGDVAAVNLNFWITPDEANLDEQSGGLRIWDKAAPADWSFTEFNSGTEKAQSRIHQFLLDNQAREIVVPYRQNRAVVFNSDLFHATDEFQFRDGYENRRINITMLFGLRQNQIKK